MILRRLYHFEKKLLSGHPEDEAVAVAAERTTESFRTMEVARTLSSSVTKSSVLLPFGLLLKVFSALIFEPQ